MHPPQLARKTALAAIAAMLSAPAYAQAIPVAVAAAGVGIYFLPIRLGLLVAKKGRRRWFLWVSLAVYVASVLTAILRPFGGSFHLTFFLPYVLIPVAIYTRWHDHET